MRGYAPTEIAPDGDTGSRRSRRTSTRCTRRSAATRTRAHRTRLGCGGGVRCRRIAPRNWAARDDRRAPLALDERLFADRAARALRLPVPAEDTGRAGRGGRGRHGVHRPAVATTGRRVRRDRGPAPRKACLRAPHHLAAAIDYYRADEPGLDRSGTPRCCARRPSRPSISTVIATGRSTCGWCATPRTISPQARGWRSWRGLGTSCISSGRPPWTGGSSSGRAARAPRSRRGRRPRPGRAGRRRAPCPRGCRPARGSRCRAVGTRRARRA